jgi:urease accessory protein
MIGAFLHGLQHPLMAPAHIIALIGLGLLIGRQARCIPAASAFGLGLVSGLAALVAAVGETDAATVLLVASALIGLAVALAVRLPLVVVTPLAVVVGVAVGLDSPPQEMTYARAIAALVGTGIGASVLVSVVAFVAAKLSQPWQAIGVRILGSWIAASAVLVLALQFARW